MISRWLTFPVWLLLFAVVNPSGAVAETKAADQLQDVFEKCRTRENPAECERALWSFADVTKDDALTPAEITRFTRVMIQVKDAIEEGAEERKDEDAPDKDGLTVIYAILFGPFAAEIFIGNFDYNDDGKVSRDELYFDLREGEADKMFTRLLRSGKEAVAEAATLADVFGEKKEATKTPKEQTEETPAEPLTLEEGSELSLHQDLVSDVQALLQQLGYNPGGVDGVTGPATRRAVKAFQADIGLEQTGEVTDSLLVQLKAASELRGYTGQPRTE